MIGDDINLSLDLTPIQEDPILNCTEEPNEFNCEQLLSMLSLSSANGYRSHL